VVKVDGEFLYQLLNRTSKEFLWCRIDNDLLCKIHAFGLVHLTAARVSVLCCCGCLAQGSSAFVR